MGIGFLLRILSMRSPQDLSSPEFELSKAIPRFLHLSSAVDASYLHHRIRNDFFL